ncbi:MAG: acyltransferase family protein [Dongiaceae bacterium]
MKYRRDIDGLRALAVVPVVLFHAGFSGFGGGFVGVDVFFVISGYLITSLIAEEIKNGRFSVLNFYERRVRRIFPALFAVLFCSMVAGYILFLPGDMRSLAASMEAATLFVSNIFLWHESGYFARAAEMKPLLHTWSLAVEEQFYIIFPVVLWLSWKWGRHWRLVTWVGLIASLAISIYGVRMYPEATFYLLPTRAWELLVGAVIALGAVPSIENRPLREMLSLLGVGLIFYAVFAFNHFTRFPGENALLPCLGAVFIIYAGMQGPNTLVARILSLRPIVFVGLISYSLYLWHWPLIVFTKYKNIAPLSGMQSVEIVAASAVIAILSWHFVEKPFRHKKAAHGPSGNLDDVRPGFSLLRMLGGNKAVAYGIGIIVLFAVIGFASLRLYSDPRVLVALYGQRIYDYDRQSGPLQSPESCLGNVSAAVKPNCLLGDREGEPSIALWGDSYADTLPDSFSSQLKNANLAAERYIMHSCPSILNTRWNDPASTGSAFVETCRRFTDAAFRQIAADKRIQTVVLMNNYLWYLESDKARLAPDQPFGNDDQRQRLVLDNIVSPVDALTQAGKKVIIVGAYPPGASAQLIARTLRMTGALPTESRITKADYLEKVDEVNSRLKTTDSATSTFIDPAGLFCSADDQNYCSFVRQDAPMLSDGSHLSSTGAGYLVQLIMNNILGAACDAACQTQRLAVH